MKLRNIFNFTKSLRVTKKSANKFALITDTDVYELNVNEERSLDEILQIIYDIKDKTRIELSNHEYIQNIERIDLKDKAELSTKCYKDIKYHEKKDGPNKRDYERILPAHPRNRDLYPDVSPLSSKTGQSDGGMFIGEDYPFFRRKKDDKRAGSDPANPFAKYDPIFPTKNRKKREPNPDHLPKPGNDDSDIFE